MLVAGLTGGLGCGKSYVADVFRELGCRVVEADELGREAMAPDGECYRAIVDAFGEADRAKLAAKVFSDPEQLSRLNAIVHPAVRRRFREILDRLAVEDPHGIVIYVAAILIETGAARDFDRLILVNCTREQQIERALARGATEADVLSRLARQLPSEKKVPWADYVIDTRGSKEETLRQTKMVYDQLKESVL